MPPTSDKRGENPYETNWIKIAPRPEWDDPAYWLAARSCNELLYDDSGFVAICKEPYGIEHSHSDGIELLAVQYV